MQIADWIDVGPISAIPPRGARALKVAGGEEIAIFRTGDDSLYALLNRCPHKQGPLSQGIVHGGAVTCPLHNWRIDLATGETMGEDKGCVPSIPVKLSGGRILISRMDMLVSALAA